MLLSVHDKIMSNYQDMEPNKTDIFKCLKTKSCKIIFLITTIMLWIVFIFNLVMISYFRSEKTLNDNAALVFYILIVILIPFLIVVPVITLGVWGYFGTRPVVEY